MNSTRIFYGLLTLALLWALFRKPFEEWQARRATGLQAGVDAATLNGYTTYNTQLYSPALWQPFLKFFKGGSYVPASSGGAASGQSVDYSVQG